MATTKRASSFATRRRGAKATECLGSATARRRFERESRLTARLQHVGIVPVYEMGRFEDCPFFTMQRIEGRPLDRVVEEQSARLALLPQMLRLVRALAYAHSQGIVHRDLKPANVMLGKENLA